MLIEGQQKKGYYQAVLDSVVIRDQPGEYAVALFVSNGPQARIGRLVLHGISHFEEFVIRDLMDTEEGRVMNSEVLLADLSRILRFYERNGFPFTKVSVSHIGVLSSAEGQLEVEIRIEEDSRKRLNDLIVLGAKRTRTSYVEYLAGVRRGNWLNRNLDEVTREIESVQLFKRLDPIDLIRISDDEVIMVVSVEEDQPGAFDLVLGYQPPSGDSPSNGLVGNGHLDLRNLFGMGRRISIRLNRLPGQISSIESAYEDPYFFGTPFAVEASFDGFQQDSTFSQQALGGGIGYKIWGGLETFLTVRREVTRPGEAGIQFNRMEQRIPRSEVTFWGLSVRFVRLDRFINPRQGFQMYSAFESGRKRRSSFEMSAGGDTTGVASVVRQQRLEARAHVYIPVFTRSVLVLGNEAQLLASREYDESDLFRFGGAQSLRGYDEERFRGRFVNRLFVETRYLFERSSYAYLFFDLGYIDRPETIDFEADTGFFPGYGMGIQFDTGIGLINTSLALSTMDAPSQAKVHVGLSLGL